MLADLIRRINEDKIAAGEDLQPPVDAEEIKVCRRRVADRLGAALPDGMTDFLSLAGGLNYNGLFLYGASQGPEARGPGGFWQGLVAANEAWREGGGFGELLVLGDTDMDILTTDLAGGAPSQRDKVTGEVVETYRDVREMLEAALAARL